MSSFLSYFRVPLLTRRRVVLAAAVALAADGIQLALGPLGWAFIDEIIDAIAMFLISLLIGFHPLLLPTFLVELVPVVDMLPSWTACTFAVIALRKAKFGPNSGPPSSAPPPAPKRPGPPDVIDV